MPRPLFSIIFILVATLVVTGQHYYIWRRLVRDPALPRRWRRIATALIVVAALCMPLSFLLLRVQAPEAFRLLAWPIYCWMGLVFLVFFCLLGLDLVRLMSRGARLMTRSSREVQDPGRRVFFARVAAGAVTLSSTSAAGWGVRNAAQPVTLREVEVPLRRLPASFDGFSIVQLTDLHLGPLLGAEWLRTVVDRVNALSPDLIAITGDLVDGTVELLRPTTRLLARLRARHGVFFCTGNHEYYSGANAWCAELTRLGIRVLRNERVSIGGAPGQRRPGFDLAGIDDHTAGRHLPDHGPDLGQALAGRDPSRELVLLAHQPLAIHDAAAAGVGLQLSGHTHGGQIWPWSYLVLLQQPYVAGLALHEGRTWIYVSEGTGYWGPPMRLGTRSEISRVTLRRPAPR